MNSIKLGFAIVAFIALPPALGLAQTLTPSGPGLRAPVPLLEQVTLSPEQVEFLSHITMVDLPDGQGGFVRTARISGINVQIVNGTGSTHGAVDGVGNLIVGYNELSGADNRTGSHNLVVGSRNDYTSFSGLVTGVENAALAPYASVSGGPFNEASGYASSVSGGVYNTASGAGSSITGGGSGIASSFASTVSGGGGNVASGYASTVSGGSGNTADGYHSSISGGQYNVATSSSYATSVSGGYANVSSGFWSSVGGGRYNTAAGSYSLPGATVSGGQDNTAIGLGSVVSGGANRSATGTDDWVAGSLFEEN